MVARASPVIGQGRFAYPATMAPIKERELVVARELETRTGVARSDLPHPCEHLTAVEPADRDEVGEQ